MKKSELTSCLFKAANFPSQGPYNYIQYLNLVKSFFEEEKYEIIYEGQFTDEVREKKFEIGKGLLQNNKKAQKTCERSDFS